MDEVKKIQRRKDKAYSKYLNEIQQEKSQKPIEWMKITITWNKSRTWGYCPRAYAEIKYKDETYYNTESKYYASGCGYDKKSTVIAEIFNDYLKYKLWNKTIEECRRNDYNWKKEGGAPYGVNAGSYTSSETDKEHEYRYYAGGIGTDCYYAISEFIGGKFECIASGDTFDVYKYIDND